MRVLGVDPGTDHSGYVVYDHDALSVVSSGEMDNDDLVVAIWRGRFIVDVMAIENIECMGFAVGRSTFDTAIWIGRFVEAWRISSGKPEIRVSRGDEKIVICGRKTYKNPKTGKPKGIGDSEIKNALKERFPQTGGGKVPSVGTKASPGPWYGVRGHAWSALAVAVTCCELSGQEGPGSTDTPLGF